MTTQCIECTKTMTQPFVDRGLRGKVTSSETFQMRGRLFTIPGNVGEPPRWGRQDHWVGSNKTMTQWVRVTSRQDWESAKDNPRGGAVRRGSRGVVRRWRTGTGVTSTSARGVYGQSDWRSHGSINLRLLPPARRRHTQREARVSPN